MPVRPVAILTGSLEVLDGQNVSSTGASPMPTRFRFLRDRLWIPSCQDMPAAARQPERKDVPGKRRRMNAELTKLEQVSLVVQSFRVQ